ncbi:MAG: CU044_5270 family protein [Conexibacter sp.]
MSIELDRLRTFRVADVTVPDAVRDAARTALMERIEAAATPDRMSARCGGRAPRRRRLVAGGLALAGAAIAAALVLGLGSGGVVAPDAATAAQALRNAAVVAEQQPDVALKPGQFWYVRTQSFQPRYDDEGWVREDWASLDGESRFVRRELPGGRTEEHAFRGALTYTFFPEELTHEQVLALPRATDALYRTIERAGTAWAQGNELPVADRTHEMFTIVGDWLRAAPPLPSDLRAALYRVAARLPDVELLGEMRDAQGRVGIGVVQADEGRRRELVFDPRTSRLLSERTVARSGALVYEVAYLESGAVDAIDARP